MNSWCLNISIVLLSTLIATSGCDNSITLLNKEEKIYPIYGALYLYKNSVPVETGDLSSLYENSFPLSSGYFQCFRTVLK